MPLSQKGYWAAIDEADFELVMGYRWEAINPYPNLHYVRRRFTDATGRHTQYMHTLLTGFSRCDHWNGDGLDNRRVNLRPVTASGNKANTRKGSGTSRFKGVSRREGNRWQAQIKVDYKNRHLGLFDSEELAALAYDATALEAFGEFAKTNKMLGLLS